MKRGEEAVQRLEPPSDRDQKMTSDEIPPFPRGSFLDAVRESSRLLTERTKISVSYHPRPPAQISHRFLSAHRST